MKNLLWVLFFLPIVGFGQNVQKDSMLMPLLFDKVGIQKVIDVDSAKKNDLYIRAKLFFAEQFKSAKEVIQLDDKEQGIILGKGLTKISYWNIFSKTYEDLFFTLKFELKDYKFRYTISDITHSTYKFPVEMYWKNTGMTKKIRKAISESLQDLSNMIESEMKKPLNKDKW